MSSGNVLLGEEEEDQQASPSGGFPLEKLLKLEELINNVRWVIPVLPNGELESLLESCISFARSGADAGSEDCQRFYREGLPVSFLKILTDEAVSSWKPDIQKCILRNCERLLELLVLKWSHIGDPEEEDAFASKDLLVLLLNPHQKFHVFNAANSKSERSHASPYIKENILNKGWLCDLIHLFGSLGGFDMLSHRLLSESHPPSIPLLLALVRPFGLCAEFISLPILQKVFVPLLTHIPAYLESLNDEELKKEGKNDALSSLIKALKYLSAASLSGEENEERIRELEMFRLQMILRQLRISSFGGKMNALNEVNRVIVSVSYDHHNPQRRSGPDLSLHQSSGSNNNVVKARTEEDFLTAERLARWLTENKVLQIVLQDSLHQPQYVEKLEKIIRFKIMEESLSFADLDDIWDAQVGQHEAIVKNVHDLLAKLAWDFLPEQLDHLFKRFQSSLSEANVKQRDKLLELIRRLAEDDKDGDMADKVLNLFWNLSHSRDVSSDILDQALSAHVKILDYSCTQNRESQKNKWLEACIEELHEHSNWVIPALRQIREICCLYSESPNSESSSLHLAYRHDVINRLQKSHALVVKVANNLTSYIGQIAAAPELRNKDPCHLFPDGRYDHIVQVRERLKFLRFLLKDGRLWLCAPQAKQIWECLAEKAVFREDREACFEWFSKLMCDVPDLDPDISKGFFVDNILQLDPLLVTEAGITCFDKFFKAVNVKEEKLILKRRSHLMNNLELVGIDYMWLIIRNTHDEEVANRAIYLLEETFTNLGPALIDSQLEIHEDFISSCMDQLRPIYDTLAMMGPSDPSALMKYRQLIRILKVLHEYISECDADFGEERAFVPLYRAARGKQLSLIVRFPNPGRQTDDLEMLVHTNDTLGSLRRQILQRLKMSPASIKLELLLNGDVLESDGKILYNTPLTDKALLTGKLSPLAGHITSSPDSSSDSSASSPAHLYDGLGYEAETSLPGVIMAKAPKNKQFLLQLADLGISRNVPLLRDSARHVLQIMPPDTHIVNSLRTFCAENRDNPALLQQQIFSEASPSETLYNLEVAYALLMPGNLVDKTADFQLNFCKAGAMACFKGLLNRKDFLPGADDMTNLLVYIAVARICKFLFCVLGHAFVRAVGDGLLPKQKAVLPSPNNEYRLNQIAHRIAPQLAKYAAAHAPLMDHPTVLSIVRLAWASSSGNIRLLAASEPIGGSGSVTCLIPEQIQLCKEAMEILTLSVALHPASLEILNQKELWHNFIIDMILLSNFKRIRIDAGEQLLVIATRCAAEESSIQLLIGLLFSVLDTTATQKAKQSSEYFVVLSCLLMNASNNGLALPNSEGLLANEITWLKRVRDRVKASGASGVEDSLLEGHLRLTKELIAFLPPEKKVQIGNDVGLLKDLIEDFIFPASKMMVIYHQTGEIPMDNVLPVCTSSTTLMPAFEVLVILCTECPQNLKVVADMLTDMFYSSSEETLYEWEYLPPVGPRPLKGFVGLKNAGATCYMNSVLQQLFMIEGVRNGVLTAEGACTDPEEDFSGEDREGGEAPSSSEQTHVHHHNHMEDFGSSRKDYNITILKQVQAIFGHLSRTKLQFYVPKGLWKHFRMQGEPVNLREQQDAVEFFMSLIDFVDEALKALGYEQRMTQVLGGVLSDQMICKTCPHRYSREEPFCVLSVEVRHHNNLNDSLTEYVKGELLDGNNAYHCASCDKKVDTMKRLCIKKLPPILVIQLKRFDYDYERECAIKFNDYFEFPRVLDMEPYTVGGLARTEGQAGIYAEPCDEVEGRSSTYRLRGMVVHSGQASGGHYYSYIKSRDKWFKFDDGEVSEVKVDDDEELKAQCYGGECVSEVYDQMSKRTSSRRQKRWWNAYMLFYCRSDSPEEDASRALGELSLGGGIPPPIERSIQKQNVRFLHLRNQFNNEYFKFMKQLLHCNRHVVSSGGGEELALITVQLASKFLFQSAFHTKKSLRGSALDWYDALHDYLSCSPAVRVWFGREALFAQPVRFCEYMLECPSVEVRTAFSRIVVCLAHFSLQDGPLPVPSILQQPFIPVEIVGNTLADHLLSTVLSLLWMEVSEHGRHINQYFSFFSMYASLGIPEKTQLLKLNVPAIFIQVAIDEGPGPPIKYQYVEFGKLFQVVSTLVRCCDVSSQQTPASEEVSLLANPYAETQSPIMPLQPKVAELIFGRSGYLKKLVEEANSQEDTRKLIQFCAWENGPFSNAILCELLWQISLVVPYELKQYLELLLAVLLMEDSWQAERIRKALEGIPQENNSSRDGLFETISRSNNHCHRRAYHCIKLLVSLFSKCRVAKSIFEASTDIRNKWNIAVVWLSQELDRGRVSGPASFPSSQYSYSNWSPPGQSNENTSGYFLERSHSAKLTLDAAIQLLSEEDIEESEEAESGGGGNNNNINNNSNSLSRGGEPTNSLVEPNNLDASTPRPNTTTDTIKQQQQQDPKMS